ncbi:MAG: GyrI-like domain-containing protein [Acidimicrobiales bacterium]|nr:GyrI-like domain-containing protein [Acidimicrobiales bacterium]
MSSLLPVVVELAPQDAVVVRGDVPMAEMPTFFERAFTTAAAAAAAAGVEIVGPPFGFYPEMPAEIVAIEAGFPVSSRAETAGDAHPFVLPGGRMVRAVHVGPFETMEKTYGELQAWMAKQGFHPAVGMWENYLSDPRVEPDLATWRTEIIWPIT